jgi:FkbM family methyltransferase
MLVSVGELKKFWGVAPHSLVHVGAHNAEELEAYTNAGWNSVTWIEAQPDKVKQLATIIPSHHKLIEAAVWDNDDVVMDLKIMTNTESTSLLNLGTHAEEHPEVVLESTIRVITKTLSSLISENNIPEMLALDIQGVELRALKGFEKALGEVSWIYSEVNRRELYEGCGLVWELDKYLSKFGFTRVMSKWSDHGWGDALYVNKSVKVTLSGRTRRSVWRLINLLREMREFLGKHKMSFKRILNSR